MASSGPANRVAIRVSASGNDTRTLNARSDVAEVDPAESPGDDGPSEVPQSARSRARSSQACIMCQRKKIRCTGTQPCENCQRRRWSCRFNAEGDGRRRSTTQRTAQELSEASGEVKRNRQMISGIFAIMRAGEPETITELIDEVRKTEKVGEVACFIRAKIDQDERLHQAFERVDWSPDAQLLPPSLQPPSTLDDRGKAGGVVKASKDMV